MKLILQICVLLGLNYICIQLRGAHIMVTTVLDTPYTMLRNDPRTNLTGNDRYEGYVVDLVDAISKMLNFSYELKLNNANSYGRKDETGQWNGMIGEVIDGRTHIAAGGMTITSERENAVDFTLPFMHMGIAVLYRRRFIHKTIYNDLELLISPFSNNLVDVFLVLVVIFGIILLCLRRKYKTIAFRILLGLWLLFLFLFASLFIAQLSSYYVNTLSDTKIYATPSFKTIEDLVSQQGTPYGCIEGGSTQTFFRNSKSPIYSKMWSHMAATEPSSFVSDFDEGIERVTKSDYAFIGESPVIEYAISRRCDLFQIGGLLDSKGFGLAVQQGSPFRESLSHAILVLEEQGVLSELKNKWWYQRNGGSDCLH